MNPLKSEFIRVICERIHALVPCPFLNETPIAEYSCDKTAF